MGDYKTQDLRCDDCKEYTKKTNNSVGGFHFRGTTICGHAHFHTVAILLLDVWTEIYQLSNSMSEDDARDEACKWLEKKLTQKRGWT